MSLNQIIKNISTLNEEELVQLNREVVRQIKSQRNIEARMKRHLFSAGDKVKWNGRNGPGEGKIVKDMQTKHRRTFDIF